MKENSDFNKFNKLKKIYFDAPTEAKKEEVIKEVKNLINCFSYATPNLLVVYDLSTEKYKTIGLENGEIETYDKDKSIRGILRKTYSPFIPNKILEEIPSVKLIFDPFEPPIFERNGIDYTNRFIPSKFYEIKPKQKDMIDFIPWDKYPNIKALFENVFAENDRMNFFANWLACGFQTKRKTRTAIVSIGIQGTGKGVIFEEIIKYAIGESYVTTIDNEALKSQFNGDLEGRLFVLANEIKADFRQGNSTYERIKTYIADSTLRFEEKNIKARNIPNFFNIWFHSNNAVPLQIQGSDRRYTVFNTKDKKLTEVSAERGYAHIRFYIAEIQKERDTFIRDLMHLKYNETLATNALMTSEKKSIYEASMSKLEILADNIKKMDIEYFKDALYDDFHNLNNYNESKNIIQKTLGIGSLEALLSEMKNQFEQNHIKNDLLIALYRLLVDANTQDSVVGRKMKPLLGSAKTTGTLRYRQINKDKEVTLNKTIPIQYEDKNGNIERTESVSMDGL